MKAGTVPFPRQFGPGDSGLDCRAVKGGLAVALHGAHGMNLKTNAYSAAAQKNLASFKKTHGLVDDAIYTKQAHDALQPFFTEQEGTWMNKVWIRIVAKKQRDTFVGTCRWFIAHAGILAYFQIRPIPEGLTPFELIEIIKTDCSGSIEIEADWSKLPDPSGLGFNGQGNTGTLLHGCTKITQAQAQPADLIVWRKGTWDTYGHHAAAILDPIGKNVDFDCFSNGHSGDTLAHKFSDLHRSQVSLGYPQAQFLRWLPPLT